MCTSSCRQMTHDRLQQRAVWIGTSVRPTTDPIQISKVCIQTPSNFGPAREANRIPYINPPGHATRDLSGSAATNHARIVPFVSNLYVVSILHIVVYYFMLHCRALDWICLWIRCFSRDQVHPTKSWIVWLLGQID